MVRKLFEKQAPVIKRLVELPDDDELLVEMRLPSSAEIWQIENDMPELPKPFVHLDPDGKGGFNRRADTDDPGYIVALNKWNDELAMRRVALCLEGVEVPGDTLAEKAEALRQLPYYEVQALKYVLRDVIIVDLEGIKDYPFQPDANPGDEPV